MARTPIKTDGDIKDVLARIIASIDESRNSWIGMRRAFEVTSDKPSTELLSECIGDLYEPLQALNKLLQEGRALPTPPATERKEP